MRKGLGKEIRVGVEKQSAGLTKDHAVFARKTGELVHFVY